MCVETLSRSDPLISKRFTACVCPFEVRLDHPLVCTFLHSYSSFRASVQTCTRAVQPVQARPAPNVAVAHDRVGVKRWVSTVNSQMREKGALCEGSGAPERNCRTSPQSSIGFSRLSPLYMRCLFVTSEPFSATASSHVASGEAIRVLLTNLKKNAIGNIVKSRPDGLTLEKASARQSKPPPASTQ